VISLPTVPILVFLLLASVSQLGVLFEVIALYQVCSLGAEQFAAIKLTALHCPFLRVVVSIPKSLSFLASTQLNSAKLVVEVHISLVLLVLPSVSRTKSVFLIKVAVRASPSLSTQ